MTYKIAMPHKTGSLLTALAFTALAFTALIPTVATAATLQVCSTCTYVTIQGAVTAAASGDNIEIAPGTYNESVSISGARALNLHPSSGRVTIDASGFDRALEVLHANAVISLEDMDLTNAVGFAGLVNFGNLVIDTVYVISNSGTFGGIFNAGSLVTGNNSVIAANTATNLGSAGGLNNFAWVDLWNTTVIGNVGHEGGGFKSSGNSRVTVYASSISGNQATSMGGGYFTSSLQALVDIKSSSSFSSNTAAFCNTYYDVNKLPQCVN